MKSNVQSLTGLLRDPLVTVFYWESALAPFSQFGFTKPRLDLKIEPRDAVEEQELHRRIVLVLIKFPRTHFLERIEAEGIFLVR